MFSALFSFLGGSVFRMVWGEVSTWVTAKQDHAHENEKMKKWKQDKIKESFRYPMEPFNEYFK